MIHPILTVPLAHFSVLTQAKPERIQQLLLFCLISHDLHYTGVI